jgi:hypothetical protein
MPKVGKEICEWDTCDIAQAQADYLKEDHPELSDDERFRMACEDPNLYESEWACLCDYLTELMGRNQHGGWRAKISNFGWRSLNGKKLFHAANGKELLREVLPQTDCTFKV